MAVKTTYGAPTYNKPPPDKKPFKAEYPFKPDVGIGEEIWVSRPKIDKLVIIGDLLPKHFPEFMPETLEEYSQKIMAPLSAGAAGKPMHGQTIYDGKLYWQVHILSPATGSAVNFKLSKALASSQAVHRLRIELSPNAVTSDGILDLLDVLHGMSGKKFAVGAFLADARVTRLDVAVDMVGVSVPDVIVTAKYEGKRTHYYGQDGVLESVYVHRTFKPYDPDTMPADKMAKRHGLGTMIVRVYDKARERISVGKKPPFGPAPVTRVEIEKRRFGNKVFGLDKLPALANMFLGKRIGHIRTQPVGNLRQWLHYVEFRRGGGPDWAAQLLALTTKEQAAFHKAYISYPSNLVDPQAVWAMWPEALQYDGVQHMVDAAQHKSGGSLLYHFPLPSN